MNARRQSIPPSQPATLPEAAPAPVHRRIEAEDRQQVAADTHAARLTGGELAGRIGQRTPRGAR